jgi:hypothetical protein
MAAVSGKDVSGAVTALAVLVIGGWLIAATTCHTRSPADLAAEADQKLIADARWAARSRMRDPDSARFEGLRVSRAGGAAAVCGTLNARNGFGGYGGPQPFFVVGGVMTSAADLPQAAFVQAWSQHCAG